MWGRLLRVLAIGLSQWELYQISEKEKCIKQIKGLLEEDHECNEAKKRGAI